MPGQPHGPSPLADHVAALIEAAFPGFGVRSVRPLGEGWVNTLWLVNDEWVFRFPKTAAAARGTRLEMALAPELVRALPVPVPDFALTAPFGVPGFRRPFAGYHYIPGVRPDGQAGGTAAAPEGAAGAPPQRERAARLAAGLAAFINALHRFPVKRAQAMGVPGGTPGLWRRHHQRWYAKTRAVVSGRMAPAELAATDRMMEDYLGDGRNFAFSPVLLHRDLGPENMLVDPTTGELTGVIDFEDAMVGDPAFDFTGVLGLCPGLLEAYDGPRDPGFEERIAFYRRLVPLHELRYHIETESVAQPD